MEDQIEALERSADITGGGQINLANLTDGLRAEREQGITIDVAYRYFATPRRKFIVADTPGPRAVHAQHGDRAPRPPTSPSSSSMPARA
jgi:sulfate adenylyltransferase subunit 1 (EFTu-like GTPase family)